MCKAPPPNDIYEKLPLSAAEYNNKSRVKNPLAVNKNLDVSLYEDTIYMFYYILRLYEVTLCNYMVQH